MARILIVGCGCRGRALAAELAGDGHAVRGTSRSAEGLAAIEAAGIEPALADPDRLGTVLGALGGVGVLVWLLGSANGDPQKVAAIHGPRLASLMERIVDTPCRGAVYEASGSVAPELLDGGVEIALRAGRTYVMPVEILRADQAAPGAWVAAAVAAVTGVLAA